MIIEQSRYDDMLAQLHKQADDVKRDSMRRLCRENLYFLIRYIFNRPDFDHPWLYDRCNEVQQKPHGYIDLWARDHRKSTIITFGHSIQEILQTHGEGAVGEPVTICILSHTRPIAKSFLRQIKRELESNKLLLELFPDILWENPGKDAPNWSEDSGLVVQRKGNPKEATVEAWGLVEGMPTGKHFNRLVYDDVVTPASVSTPEMIYKTTQAWELSDNLGSSGKEKVKIIGTRYHANDTYRTMLERKVAKPRIYPATTSGEADGDPVLLDKQELDRKRRKQGSYVFSCQMLLNPVADKKQGFLRDWLRFYHKNAYDNLNIYILVDPANEKTKKSDYTAIEVVGLGADKNYYTLDLIRDKLSLKERTQTLFRLHQKWNPISVGYEKYGMQSDIEHIKEKMDDINYHFGIVPLAGKMSKNDRIRKLQPIFEEGRWYLPSTLHYTDYEGRTQDLVDTFLIEEYDAFPVPVHDDMLDVKARILDEDLNATWPMIEVDEAIDRYSRRASRRRSAMTI